MFYNMGLLVDFYDFVDSVFYRFSLPQKCSVLVFSTIGYPPQENSYGFIYYEVVLIIDATLFIVGYFYLITKCHT